MTKLLLSAAFILITSFGMAQSRAFKDDVKKVARITQESEFQMATIKDQILPMVAADKQEAFLKDFDDLMKPLEATIEKFYLANYTHDEVKQMLKYYDSPLGKKVTANASKLNTEKMVTLQEIGDKMNEMMTKYMQ